MEQRISFGTFQLKYVDQLQSGSQIFQSEETETNLSIWIPTKISGIFGIMESTRYFQHFPDSIWALRTIKIETILSKIFYVYYNCFFPQNRNHWLLAKFEMIIFKCWSKKLISMFQVRVVL